MGLIDLVSPGSRQTPPPSSQPQPSEQTPPPAEANSGSGASAPPANGTSSNETQSASANAGTAGATSSSSGAGASSSNAAASGTANRDSAPVTGAAATRALAVAPRTAAAIDQLREAAMANLEAMRTQSMIDDLGTSAPQKTLLTEDEPVGEAAQQAPQAVVETVKEAYRESERA